MQEFTYTVFQVVASMIGVLITLFVGVIAAALVTSSETPVRLEADAPAAEAPQAYRLAA